ncbi:MAG: prolipoprotein diacylglyceryl transferase family protein [Candidatus Sericytochromatia bacterium]
MTFPINIHICNIIIDSHLFFEILAYTIGFRYYIYLKKSEKDLISEENRLWIFIGAAFGALIFSRLLGILENIDILSKQSNYLTFFLSSKTIVGGLLGGLIGVEITKKILKVNTSSGDLMTYPLILGIAIGRIGCFLSGVKDGTYGNETALPWALDLGDGVYRHPTSLYEIIFLITLFSVIKYFDKNKSFSNGAKFRIFLSFYLVFRFFIEFIKPFYRFEFGLSPIQIACIIGIIYYYRVFLYPKELFMKESDNA